MNVAIRNQITEAFKAIFSSAREQNQISTDLILETKHYLTTCSDPCLPQDDLETELYDEVYRPIFNFLKRSIGGEFIDQIIETLFHQRSPETIKDIQKTMYRVIDDHYSKVLMLGPDPDPYAQ